jgi:excinuclease ABC subunit B
MTSKFKLKSGFKPDGDQPQAIKSLIDGLKKGERHQTLLGVTGSGKTFTMANVIEKVQKPTLVIAHNKTLAAQLAQEYKEFFPNNAVHYFVSYYDYYQPEAYMATTDTYIEKEAQINNEIERLRHASTQALLIRNDAIIVASVSCIYGLGSPEEYKKVNLKLSVGNKLGRREIIQRLIDIHFERTNADLEPGHVRVVGNSVEIMPAQEKVIYRLNLGAGSIDAIIKVNAITREIIGEERDIFVFPAKHFITPENQRKKATESIKHELDGRLKELKEEGKVLEHERLKRRTSYDLALIREVGYCNGIENYSRHFSGKKAGDPPDTLLSYFPDDFLTIIDESHVTVPQIGGMYNGDASRKRNLVEYGFRLPSALDNRPLKFREFDARVGQTIYTSATPGNYERENSTNIAEQVIRPTGLIDPEIEVRPILSKLRCPTPQLKNYGGQVQDFILEAEKAIKKGQRVLATTLTKKMAEDLADFLKEKGIKTTYLHSDIKTFERIEILTDFRKGEYDILVGVNLLREGLDLPEVALIGILDADKEGFLRSETSLVQTIGRAARNVDGRVILYADNITGSMQRAIDETNRRRELQLAYNKKHRITPKTIQKEIKDIRDQLQTEHTKTVGALLAVDAELYKKNPKKLITQKEKQMNASAKIMDFETAAILRDEIKALQELGKSQK